MRLKSPQDGTAANPPQRKSPMIALAIRKQFMPYVTNLDLPASVQRRLPEHAQDIYREAFNHAFAAHSGDPRQEEASHRIAWAAVKRCYVKIGEDWVESASSR
jgi:cation transport regulator